MPLAVAQLRARATIMVAIPNKRQQARNERALQDLIRTVPGNDRCADCDARNPSKWLTRKLPICRDLELLTSDIDRNSMGQLECKFWIFSIL